MTESFSDELQAIETDLIDGIAEERRRAGLSQAELSKKLGASDNLMNKIESHKRGLEAAVVVLIAKHLNLSEGTLIRRAKSHAKKARELRSTSNNVKL